MARELKTFTSFPLIISLILFISVIAARPFSRDDSKISVKYSAPSPGLGHETPPPSRIADIVVEADKLKNTKVLSSVKYSAPSPGLGHDTPPPPPLRTEAPNKLTNTKVIGSVKYSAPSPGLGHDTPPPVWTEVTIADKVANTKVVGSVKYSAPSPGIGHNTPPPPRIH